MGKTVKTVFDSAVQIGFAMFALTVLTPLLPGIEYKGDLLAAVLIGCGFYAYQRLWQRGTFLVLRIPQASCPMPGIMRWVVLSTVIGFCVFIGALSYMAPQIFAVNNPLWILPGAIVAILGMMLSNIVTQFGRIFDRGANNKER